MKKILSLALALIMTMALAVPAFAASPDEEVPQSYTLNIDGEIVTLKEGEVVSIPLQLTDAGKELLAESGVQTYLSFPGDAGVLNIWGSGTRFYWSIEMAVPATSFAGSVTATNLTTGFSSGTAAVSGFSGNCSVGTASGHHYGASISGVAYLLTVPVAKTVTNYVHWIA